MTTLSIAALVLASGLTGQAPAAGWKALSIENGAMRISFPGEPKSTSATVPGSGGPIRQTTYSLKTGGSLYSVQHFRYPLPNARSKLAAEKKAQIQGQELIQEKDLEIDGMEGGEFQVKGPSPQGNGTVITWTRHFLKGANYYTITVMSPPDKPLPAEARRFMESVHFGNAKAAPAMRRRPGDSARNRVHGRTGANLGSATAADTPEAALRSFMLAMVTHDEPALKALTLPVPDSDLAWLLKGEAVPAGELEQARAFFSTMKIQSLKPGDRVDLPGGRTITVRPTEVTDTRAVLMTEGAPLPTRVQKFQGRWRVDARPIIAGRKAADAARKKKAGGR